MPGTELAYGAIRCEANLERDCKVSAYGLLRAVRDWRSIWWCCGTDLAYGSALSGTDLAYCATAAEYEPRRAARYRHSVNGATVPAYSSATRCPVLKQRTVLPGHGPYRREKRSKRY
eukprot:3515842-Rhodomonas_salina.5